VNATCPNQRRMETAYLLTRNFVSYFFLLLFELEDEQDDVAADAGLLRFVLDGCTVMCIDA
jgi:predicted ribosome-associated RNA-binding protein Tma20